MLAAVVKPYLTEKRLRFEFYLRLPPEIILYGLEPLRFPSVYQIKFVGAIVAACGLRREALLKALRSDANRQLKAATSLAPWSSGPLFTTVILSFPGELWFNKGKNISHLI